MVQVIAGAGSGSGVIVEVDERGAGLVLTNYHVVQQGDDIDVIVNDSISYPARFLGYDTEKDLAALEICCSAQFHAVPLAGEQLTPGEAVFAMGYPLGSGQALITSGVVSRVMFDNATQRWLVQTDAAINPGNSGGPLITLDAEVVGINTFVVRESLFGVPLEGFGFAVSARTVSDVLPSLKTGTIKATLTPTPAATPTPTPTLTPTLTPTPTPTSAWQRAGLRRFGPVDGVLQHDTDQFIEEFNSGVLLSDFVAMAVFDNPEGGENWDYGFVFRQSKEDHLSILIVSGNGKWGHYRREGQQGVDVELDSGRIQSLKTGSGDANEIQLVAAGQVGLFFLNGEFISGLTLSQGSEAGDVSVITGYYRGHETLGRSTVFRGFRVNETKWVGTKDGELPHKDDGEIRGHAMGIDVKDFLAHAVFVNPYSRTVGPWSHGILFRHLGKEQFQGVVINSDGTWLHFVRDGSNSPSYEDSGAAPLNLGPGDLNRIAIAAVGGAGLLSINGEFVGRLDIGPSPESGDIWVATGFYEGAEFHGYSTKFEGFEVWSLD